MSEQSHEVQEVISDLLRQIDTGLGEEYLLQGPIVLDLPVVIRRDEKGGLLTHIVDEGASVPKERVARLKLKVVQRDSVQPILGGASTEKVEFRITSP